MTCYKIGQVPTIPDNNYDMIIILYNKITNNKTYVYYSILYMIYIPI